MSLVARAKCSGGLLKWILRGFDHRLTLTVVVVATRTV
jgi:hypothetical protein